MVKSNKFIQMYSTLPVGLFPFTKEDTLISERVLLNNPVNGIIQNESGAVVTTVDGSKYEVSSNTSFSPLFKVMRVSTPIACIPAVSDVV